MTKTDEAKGRMTVNETERTLVNQARAIEKLEKRLMAKAIEAAGIEHELEDARAALRAMLPPASGTDVTTVDEDGRASTRRHSYVGQTANANYGNDPAFNVNALGGLIARGPAGSSGD